MKYMCILFFFLSANGAFAQDPQPSAEDILNRMQASFNTIEDYVVTLEATIEMKGVNIPRREATLFYKKPDKIHIESKGLMFLPKQPMVLNAHYLREKFSPSDVQKEATDGNNILYRLKFAPKEEGADIRIVIWVEDKHWSIKKMEITRFKGGVIVAHVEYMMIKGKYWLPRNVLVKLTIPAGRHRFHVFEDPGEVEDWKKNDSPQIRKGIVTISFKQYRGVNAGLSDEVFKRK
jgi:outer membrane lipoprotein-sorting protein